MERFEIFHRLVKAEQNTQKLYDEAVRRKDGLSEFTETKIKKIRETEFADAELKIAEYESGATADADKAIRELDMKLDRDLTAYRVQFDQHRDSLADSIFEIAINRSKS